MATIYDKELVNPIKMSADDNLILTCPHCEWDYTHQGDVQVWHRAEDEAHGTWANITRHGATSCPVLPDGNPSPRRNGLRVKMDCENCGSAFSLIVAQHKGQTYLYAEAYVDGDQ